MATIKKIFLLVLLASPILWALYLLPNAAIPYETKVLLASGDPLRKSYEDYKKNFNLYEDYLILQTDSPFTSPQIQELSQNVITELKGKPYVKNIYSLANAKTAAFDGHKLTVRKASEDFFGASNEKTSSLGAKTFLSPSNKALLFAIELQPQADGSVPREIKSQFAKDLIELSSQLQKAFPYVRAFPLGFEIYFYYFIHEVEEGLLKAVPLLLIITAILLYLLFGSLKVVILSVGSLSLALAIEIMTMVYVAGGISPYSMYALLFSLSVGATNLVHLFTQFQTSGYKNSPEKIFRVRDEVLSPCFWSSFVTGLGFGALILHPSPIISDFGLFSTTGLLFCLITTLYILPQFIRVLGIPIAVSETIFERSFLPALIFITKYRRQVVSGFLVFTFACGLYSLRLKMAEDLAHSFTPSHPLSKAYKVLESEFGYQGGVDLVFGKATPSLWTPQGEHLQEDLYSSLLKIPNIANIFGVYSVVKEIRSLSPDWANAERAPLLKASQLNSVFEIFDQELRSGERFYSRTSGASRWNLALKSLASDDLKKTMDRIEAIANQTTFREGLNPSIQGYVPLLTKVMSRLIKDFLNSFVFAVITIWIAFYLAFGSFKISTLAMIPNCLPLFFSLGFMALLGVKIENNLVILACIVLGLSVDDNIHFLYSYQTMQIDEVLWKTGPRLIRTSLAVIASLLSLFVTHIRVFNQIALVFIVTLIFATCADVILFPALLRLIPDRPGWKRRSS